MKDKQLALLAKIKISLDIAAGMMAEAREELEQASRELREFILENMKEGEGGEDSNR